jgi:hypothetical protein
LSVQIELAFQGRTKPINSHVSEVGEDVDIVGLARQAERSACDRTADTIRDSSRSRTASNASRAGLSPVKGGDPDPSRML